MKFFPYENFYLTTQLQPNEVVSKIQENVSPRSRNIFQWKSDRTRPYQGLLDNNEFRISRIIRYRNSFLPIIKGEILKSLDGTRIHLKMRMHFFVYVFMFVWLG